ncbi:MAG: heparinase II/III family protein [Armatimonadetes bacterium]|nr:heparinase II/III family protein [Armatimonadota bacterium]
MQLPRFAPGWEEFLKEREADLTLELWPALHEIEDPVVALESRQSRLMNAANRAEILGLAFALTGDKRFGKQGRDVLSKIVADDTSTWMTPVHKQMYPEVSADLHVALLSRTIAYAYSLLRPLVNRKLQLALWEKMKSHGPGVIYRDSGDGTNRESQINNRKSAWWSDAYNSNWSSVLNGGLGVAALAFLEMDRKATRRWIAVAKDRLVTMLDLVADEGAGLEGTSYWFTCFGPILEFCEGLRNVTGENLFDHPFWKVAHEYLTYLTMPDFSGFANFGDAHYPGLHGSWILYGIASRANNGRAQWLANRVSEKSEISHRDLLFYDPKVVEIPPHDLPADRLFKSIHLATFRSSWEEDAVFLAVKGGSNSWSHCHLDLNSFILHAYGEYLAVDPGAPGYGAHYFNSVEPPVSTAWHNTITVDGANQRQPPRYRMSYNLEEGGGAYCRLSGFSECETFAMVSGDATSAYGDTLKRFHRHVVFLKPNCFLLYDDIIVKKARTQRHFEWLLHSVAPIVEVGPNRIEIRGKKASLIVQPILPQSLHCKFLPDRTTGSRSEPLPVHCLSMRQDWQHLWNVNPADSPFPQWDVRRPVPLIGRHYRYLVILTALKTGDTEVPAAQLLPVRNGVGVRLEWKGRVSTVIWKPRKTTVSVENIQTQGTAVDRRKCRHNR